MELINIELGTSLFYYIYLLLIAGLFVGLYYGLRHKSKQVQKRVLFGLLAVNFALHFIKLSFPEYINAGFPGIIRKCTAENICAVSTLIFPFIYLSDWKVGKDYMFYLGTISGFLSCFAPMPIVGLPFYSLETIRCYFCHAILWQVPLLMVIFGHHKIDYRRIWKSIVMYFLVLCVIIVNELIVIRIGWWTDTTTIEEFLDPSTGRDMGYAIGVPESMSNVAKYVLWMTPKAWRNVPVLWELFPVIIYGGFVCLCLSIYWEHEHIRQDLLKILNKIKSLKKGEEDEEYSQNNSDIE